MPHNRCPQCNSLLIEGEAKCWNCAQKISKNQEMIADEGGAADFSFDSSQFGDSQKGRYTTSQDPEEVEDAVVTERRNAYFNSAAALDEDVEKRKQTQAILVAVLLIGIGAAVVFFLM